MLKTSNIIFNLVKIVIWIIFVGLCIEACALLVNFLFSIFKPEIIQNLYQKLDLTKMYQKSKLIFYGVYGFILFISILKVGLFYIAIKLVTKIDLKQPFSPFASNQIYSISYYSFSLGIISYITNELVKKLKHYGIEIENLASFWEGSQSFIFMSAVLYIIAVIFKKGVDLQSENDLTI